MPQDYLAPAYASAVWSIGTVLTDNAWSVCDILAIRVVWYLSANQIDI